MKTELAYDAVFQALVDIKKNLDEKINLLDEQIRRAQLECLDDAFQQEKDALAECLDGIDQQLITLSVYIEEYQHLHGSLRILNEKIAELRGKPPVMPETIAGDSLLEVLAGRLDYLKSQGKIRDC
jgi:DNA repair exonuclease SbcCD ATPase subunit